VTAAPASTPVALDRLAAALGPGFSTIVVHRAGRRPRLTVVDRHTLAATEVCADDHGRYLWPWAAPATITSDPLTAAQTIARVLRPAPGSGHE
jgi:hypothetical protein